MDRQLAAGSAGLADVRAILVGHSHYDHLMDVPYIAMTKAKGRNHLRSQTMRHLLSALVPQNGSQC
jgi:phosphoribosyl 1,2-cyclic phosphodiesterase